MDDREKLIKEFTHLLAVWSTLSLMNTLARMGYEDLLQDEQLIQKVLEDPELKEKRSEIITACQHATHYDEFTSQVASIATQVGEMAAAKMIELVRQKAN